MIPISRPTCCLALLLSFACLPATSEEFRQRGAHVHGEGTLGIAVEGATLTIEFLAPAVNVVGFEHEPRSAADKQATAQADNLLQSARDTIGLPVAAACKLVKASVTRPEWTAEGEDDHDDEEHGEEHVNYSARWEYRCANPQALSFVEPWIFAKLKNMHQLNASVITASTQRQQAVTGAKQRILLE